MHIGPELKTFCFNKPSLWHINLYIPEIVIAHDPYYGDRDFTISLPSIFNLSSYEYGFIFRLVVLGFGFEIWLGSNLK